MESNLPLVSIVVINYNNAQWVEETLDSIAAQTYQSIELIIVDDCSTDNSPELIEAWLKNYTKLFKFIRHDKNKGICATCNTGFKIANGSFVSYIASDDSMLPEKTEKQVDILKKSAEDIAMVYSDAYLMNDDGNPIYGWFIQKYRQDFVQPPSGWIFDELLKGNFIPAMSIMFKKEVLKVVGYFDESLVFEDYDMWLRIASKYKIVYSSTPSVKYRIRKESLIKKIKSWNPSLIKILLKFQDKKNVRDRLIEIAKTSYRERDSESLKLLKGSVKKIPPIKRIMRLIVLRIPYFIGKRIVY